MGFLLIPSIAQVRAFVKEPHVQVSSFRLILQSIIGYPVGFTPAGCLDAARTALYNGRYWLIAVWAHA
jgi:hypothetical protein